MGFYIRKAISVGPFRFNLSKSGVGISAGVRGFRVGAGPRGNYVHMGRGGLYYRTTLNGGGARGGGGAPTPAVPLLNVEMTDIESAATATIVDASSAELVAEMNAKRMKLQAWPFVAAVSVVLCMYLNRGLGAPAWAVYSVVVLGIIATAVTGFYDRLRKTTVLMYELEPDVETRFQKLHDAFGALAGCQGRWHVSASGSVADRKYNAGASTIVKRKGISVLIGNPPFVKSNISAPSLPVGRQVLHFFPDKVLVFELGAVGAVSYKNLVVNAERRQFVEDGSVPGDAEIVGRTWKYVNKNGGPDKRFKDNRELPIARYEELAFTSSTGLNEVVQVSRTGIGNQIAAAIKGLAAVSE